MTKLYWLLAILVCSCQTIELKVDPTIPSIDAGYGTVETVCDHRSVGVNACSVRKGQPTKDVQLTVRTVQSGTLSVFSSECNVDWATKYSESQYLVIPLPELIGPLFEKTCLLSILINPEYEDQEESTIKVHGFQAEVLIKVFDDGQPATIGYRQDAWNGVVALQLRKPPTNPSDEIALILVDVNGSQQGSHRLIGCGEVHGGRYHNYSNIFYTQYKIQKPCIYHGAVVPEDQDQDLLFSVMVNTFKNDYIKLDIPNFIVDGGDLLLDFDQSVTFVELDNKSYNKSQVTIKGYDRDEHYEVRAYTVKGRYIVGIHESGIWKWYR